MNAKAHSFTKRGRAKVEERRQHETLVEMAY